MVATAVLSLSHVPPAEALVSVPVLPSHTASAPDMADGVGCTVTTVVVLQPPAVYTIVAFPAVSPLTTPVLLMVATVVLLLVQLPPVVDVLSAVVLPAHTDNVPVMAAGIALMVTTAVLLQPAPVL